MFFGHDVPSQQLFKYFSTNVLRGSRACRDHQHKSVVFLPSTCISGALLELPIWSLDWLSYQRLQSQGNTGLADTVVTLAFCSHRSWEDICNPADCFACPFALFRIPMVIQRHRWSELSWWSKAQSCYKNCRYRVSRHAMVSSLYAQSSSYSSMPEDDLLAPLAMHLSSIWSGQSSCLIINIMLNRRIQHTNHTQHSWT
jgi:hypothetical protein